MPFGLPLRTMNETTEVVTSPSCGAVFHAASTMSASTRRFMSGSIENETTSAARPASTARLCSPEAPNEVLKLTSLPASVFLNAGMISS